MRFSSFLSALDRAVSTISDERRLAAQARALVGALVANDDWLPQAFARPGATYKQYLLYLDPAQRYSVVSFVWGANQSTPIHDHGTWGAIGVLRGAEISQSYARAPAGGLSKTERNRLDARATALVAPWDNDIHHVENAHSDRVSISIHVYGGDIGTRLRYVYDPESGAARPFVSGYSSVPVGLPLDPPR